MSVSRNEVPIEHAASGSHTEPDPRARLFADRYGALAYDELLQLFASPCVTYADIAKRFGVTRERVRQWHLNIAPGSPRGHQRRRLCQQQQLRRRLLEEPVYRAFIRAARTAFPDVRVQAVSSRTGFRKRLVKLEKWTVALKTAAPRGSGKSGSYALTGCRSEVDFVFFLLGADTFIFVPRSMVPRGGTTFRDTPTSKYHAFRNTLHSAVIENSQGRSLCPCSKACH